MWNGDILELFKSGGFTLGFIVFLSLVAVTIALERAVSLWHFLDRAQELGETVGRCLRRGAWAEARSACERSRSPVADLFLLGFEHHGRSSDERLKTAVERERQRISLDLRRWMWLLGTIGASSPCVGLLGTVWGTMRALQEIGLQSKTGIEVVGPGIGEALITTAFGILVGLEAILFYNGFQSKLHRVALELKHLTDEFLESLADAAPAAPAPGPAPAPLAAEDAAASPAPGLAPAAASREG